MKRGIKILLTITCLMMVCVAFQATAEEKAGDSGKVAVINGTVISQDQFDREMIPVQEVIQASGKTLDEKSLAAVKQKVLDNIIKSELLYQECQKNGVVINDEEINQRYATEKGKFASDEEFQNRLKELKNDEATYKSQIKRQLAIQRLINQKFKPNITDDDAKKYFETNADKYKDQSFDQVKDTVKKAMGTEMIADSYIKYYTEVRNKAKVETFLK